MSGVRYRVDAEAVSGGGREREQPDGRFRGARRGHWFMHLLWWRHPGYIGVRRRDFYAWRRA